VFHVLNSSSLPEQRLQLSHDLGRAMLAEELRKEQAKRTSLARTTIG
jgi:hypothetical protein